MIIKKPELAYSIADWGNVIPYKDLHIPVIGFDPDSGIRVLQFKYRIQLQSITSIRRNSLRKLRGSLSAKQASAMLDEFKQMREEWERDIC